MNRERGEENLNAVWGAFSRECEAIRSAARMVFGETTDWSHINKLCNEYLMKMEAVLEWAVAGRQPTVVVLADNDERGRWVLDVVQQNLFEETTAGGGDHDGKDVARQRIPSGGARQTSESLKLKRDLCITYVSVHDLPGGDGGLDADVVIYVVSFERIQTASAIGRIRVAAGISVVPVVMEIPPKMCKDEAKSDLKRFQEALEQNVGESLIAECVAILDLEVRVSDVEPDVARDRLWKEVEPRLAGLGNERGRGQAAEGRCNALRADFVKKVGAMLQASPVGGLREVLKRLDDAQKETLRACTVEWLAGGNDLQVPIRTRLRLLTCQVTPPMCFPFRTILGLLALTHSVWDRLVLTVAGSPVAMVMTAYQSIRNLRNMRQTVDAVTEKAAERVARRVVTRLRLPLDDARRAIAQVLHDDKQVRDIVVNEVRVDGVEGAIQRAHEILRTKCDNALPKRRITYIGWLSTLVFAVTLSGPLVALYGDYLAPLAEVWRGHDVSVTEFPELELSRLVLGIVLGAIPLAVVGMLLLTYVSRPQLSERLQESILMQIQDEISQMIDAGTLRLEGVGESFREIRYLLRMIPDK